MTALVQADTPDATILPGEMGKTGRCRGERKGYSTAGHGVKTRMEFGEIVAGEALGHRIL